MSRPKSFRRTLSSMLTRDEARELLNPLADEYLLPAIQFGLQTMSEMRAEHRRPLTKRTLANMLNDYVVDDAVKRLTGVASVRIDTDYGFTTFVVQESAALRIKKTDKNGKYRNYPTEQQTDLLYQYLLPGMGMTTQVIFGYHLDVLWRSIKQVSFSCWRGESRHWEIPVADDLHAYLPAIAADESKARRSVVIPKEGKKRRKQGG